MLRPEWTPGPRSALILMVALCGCDEWLATKRDDSPPPRLASAETYDRPTRIDSPVNTPSPRLERPMTPPAHPNPTPSAAVNRPAMPPPPGLAPMPGATTRPPLVVPQPSGTSATPPQQATPRPVPPSPRPFPAAPRFPGAPPQVGQPGAMDAPGGAKFDGRMIPPAGQRMAPGAHPMMPRMPNMRIARPMPAEQQ